MYREMHIYKQQTAKSKAHVFICQHRKTCDDKTEHEILSSIRLQLQLVLVALLLLLLLDLPSPTPDAFDMHRHFHRPIKPRSIKCSQVKFLFWALASLFCWVVLFRQSCAPIPIPIPSPPSRMLLFLLNVFNIHDQAKVSDFVSIVSSKSN